VAKTSTPRAFPDLSDLTHYPDPQPRYGWHSIRNGVISLLMLTGFWHGGAVEKRFHQWSEQRIAPQVQTPTPTPEGEAEPASSNASAAAAEASTPSEPGLPSQWAPVRKGLDQAKEAGSVALNATLDGVAHADQAIRTRALPRYMQDLYIDLLRWEALTISILAAMAAVRRTIHPRNLWKELEKRGVKGENTKIAVITTGSRPDNRMRQDKMAVIPPNNQKTGLWFLPAGPVVTLIEEGSPESTVLLFPAVTKHNAKEMLKQANALYKMAKETPDALNPVDIRRIYAPVIGNIAQAVHRAVAEKADVIHIAFNPEHSAMAYLLSRMALAYLNIGYLKTLQPFQGKAGKEANAQQRERYWRLIQCSKSLVREQKQVLAVSDALRDLYEPLRDALDAAYKNNIPVVIDAGNYGGHKGNRADVVGNINPLCLVDHPGLLVVGSTNSQGVISDFTSECNDIIHPFVGALGSHEVDSRRTSVLDRSWGQKLLFPLGSVFTHYLRGLSLVFDKPLWMKLLGPFGGIGTRWLLGNKGGIFAAADLSLLYLKMKEIDPSLTVEEAKAILLQTAAKASFSPAYLEKLKTEIQEMGESLPLRNQSSSFAHNCLTGLEAIGKTPWPFMEVPTGLGQLRIDRPSDGQPVRLSLVSRLDRQRWDTTFPQDQLSDPDFETSQQLWNWINQVVEGEQAKLSSLTDGQKMQVALDMERGRRVGNGHIVGRRMRAVALAEAGRKLKEEQARQAAQPQVDAQNTQAAADPLALLSALQDQGPAGEGEVKLAQKIQAQ
jgi:hypothetical protein